MINYKLDPNNIEKEIAILSTMGGEVYNRRLEMICYITGYSKSELHNMVSRFKSRYHKF